jgi:predicted nuclease of predicted toxin-antitoxin system
MWLLDANMPVQLVALLQDLAIEADTAAGRGWNALSNGSLVSAAARAKFTVLLTRDRLFGETAAAALRTYPDFCVVRVTLPQLRAAAFMQAFRAAWQQAPITPAPGRMIEWPAKLN